MLHDQYTGVVAALIMTGNKYLIQHHNKSQSLVIPVGKVDPGENREQALTREMFEELGITITRMSVLVAMDISSDMHPGSTYPCTIYKIDSFTGQVTNKEPEKHSKLAYLSLAEIKRSSRTIKLSPIVEQLIKKRFIR